MLDVLWLVPALPLAGAVVLLAGALRFRHSTTSVVALSSTGLSLAVALGALLEYSGAHPSTLVQQLFRWISAGNVTIDLSLRLDTLSGVMLFFVTFVGFLIHVYSLGYMHSESDTAYARYFAYLNLFMFAMLTLVLAGNLVVMFVGWEGVGLCSYLLIGFYFDKEYCSAAGLKAFIVNRIGDLGFLLAIFLALKTFGTVDFAAMQNAIAVNPAASAAVITPIALLLFVGAIGKSAQLPLYVWLPDAMAGPTPVSALIHAATMVTAGVYMVARTNFIYRHSPVALLVVATIGGLTAFFAATIGIAQNDIKKVLAYSTVSQLGYMFLGAGAGAFAAGIFHVFTHAFFKACLFLGSGAIIHAMNGEQDMRKMGGLRRYMPTTYWTFMAATLAISGIPFFSGFFSKDEILGKVFAAGVGNLGGFGSAYFVLWVLGVAGAFLTAFYMFRALYMTFHGEFRGGHEAVHHLHEAPASMTWPLRILGVGSAVVGFLGVSSTLTFGRHLNWFEGVVATVAPSLEVGHTPTPGVEWVLIAVSVAVALAGIWLARQFYHGPQAFRRPKRLVERFPGLYAAVANKYYIDEAYDRVVVRPLAGVARFSWKGIDTVVIDGTLNASAFFTEMAGDLLRFLQTGNVRNYGLLVLLGALAAAAWLLL
jgi:NADH-quinone oxidoreductase subunit L